MENSTIVHTRNTFIILFFIPIVIVHMITLFFYNDLSELVAALTGAGILMILLTMTRLGVNPFALRFVIIISFNIYLFVGDILNPDFIRLFFFYFPDCTSFHL